MKQPELANILQEAKLFTTRVSKSGDCYIVYKLGQQEDLKRFEERLRDVMKPRARAHKLVVTNKGVKGHEIFIAFELQPLLAA